MLHHRHPYTQTIEVHIHIGTYSMVPHPVVVHRVPAADLRMTPRSKRSSYTLITLAACRTDLAQPLSVTA